MSRALKSRAGNIILKFMTRMIIGFLLCLAVITGCSASATDLSTNNEPSFFSGNFHSPRIIRELNYYVANYSLSPTNHFYVVATELNGTNITEGFVYWAEDQRLLSYSEFYPDSKDDCDAWRPDGDWKLGRDTVNSEDEINGSDYLITRSQWHGWVNQCLTKGKLYTISLPVAQQMFPDNKKKQ